MSLVLYLYCCFKSNSDKSSIKNQNNNSMIDEKKLKTPFQLEKEAKELKIYREYEALIKEKGAMPGAITSYLMKKYNVHARSTIWQIRKRVEERLTETINP